MIKKIEKIIKTCDICAKEVEHFASTTKECNVVISQIKISKFRAPDEILDVCQECSDKILRKVISIGLMGGVSEDD